MSIFRASKSVLPLFRNAGQKRILIKGPQSVTPRLEYFRFLATTPTVRTETATSDNSSSTSSTTTTTTSTGVTTTTNSTGNVEYAEVVASPESIDSRVIDDLDLEKEWASYCERSQHEDIDPVEIHSLARAIKFSGGEEAISRIQVLLRDLNKRRSDGSCQRAFEEICGMLIHLFGTMDDTESAQIVFDGLVASSRYVRETTVLTLIDVIRLHGTRKELYHLCKILKERNLMPNSTAGYVRLLYAFNAFGDFNGCRYYFSEMAKRGFVTDESAYKCILFAHQIAKESKGVMDIYDMMKKDNISPSSAVYAIILDILSTGKKGQKKEEDMNRVFNDLKQSGEAIKAQVYLLMKVDPKDALKEIKDAGWSLDIREYNTFLSYYTRKNHYEDALDIYKIIKEDPTVKMDRFSYGIVMDVLAKSVDQSPESVFQLFEEMKLKHVQPDVQTYSTILLACRRAGDLKRAIDYFEEMESFGIKPNIYTFNGILNVITGAQTTNKKRLDLANHMWARMKTYNVRPDMRTYNLYLSILSKTIQPITSTSDTAVENSSLWPEAEQETSRHVEAILQTYRDIKAGESQGINPDFVTYTIVINTLCRAGKIRSALKVYDDSKLTNFKLLVTTYNHLMAALERAGKPSEVMNIWYDMRVHSVLPDNKSYEIVLDVCDQMGLVESLSMIREQRKKDFDRLLGLENERNARMNKTE